VILVGEMRDKETIETQWKRRKRATWCLHTAYDRRVEDGGENRRSLPDGGAAHPAEPPGEELSLHHFPRDLFLVRMGLDGSL